MTIDLKWLLPFICPFALYWFARVFFWVCGVDTTEDNALNAILSLILGLMFGTATTTHMEKNGVHWRITIWRKSK